jgi:hypothetical protein
MHDTAYLVITYGQGVHNYLGASEGSILNVPRSDGFLVLASPSGRKLLRRGSLM